MSDARRRADDTRVRKYLDPHLASRDIRRLTQANVARWIERLQTDGVGDSTIYATLMVLRQTLDLAVSAGVISSNPAAGLHVGSGVNVVRSVDLATALTEKQFQRLLKAVDPFYRPLIRFAGRTGTRWDETLGLQVSDLFLGDGRATVGRFRVVEGPGVREEPGAPDELRLVELTRDLVEELRDYLDVSHGWRSKDWDWVFLTKRDHKHPLRPNFNTFVWRPALEAARMPPDSHTFHDLRHTAVRRMVEEGVSIPKITEALGLSSNAVTRKMYGHWYQSLAGHPDR